MIDRIPWEHEAPRWGRCDYTAWRDSRHVRLMSAIARGLYWQLLALQWQDGFVPDDMWTAFRLLDVDDGDREVLAEIWETAISHFVSHPLDPTRLINPRQAEERWRAIDLSASRSKAGREGGVRSGKKRDPLSGGNKTTSKQSPSKAQAKPKQTRTDIDLDKETDKQHVLSERAKPDVENLFQRLGPHARKLNPDRKEQNKWIAWAKLQDVPLDELESWMGGLALLRDKRCLEWIGPDEPVTCKVYEKFPVLRSQAEGAWAKWGPGSVGQHRHDMQRLQA